MKLAYLITIEYIFGSYTGKFYVNADRDDDDDIILARARKKFNREIGKDSTISMASTSFQIVARQEL